MDSSVAKLIPQPPVGRPPSPRDKVRTLAEVAAACEQARRAGQTVVQAHGTFDLLHLGHVRHLEQARREGFATIPDTTWEDVGALKSVRENPKKYLTIRLRVF